MKPRQAGRFLKKFKKKKIEEYCLKPRQTGRFLKKKKLTILFEAQADWPVSTKKKKKELRVLFDARAGWLVS